MREAALSKAIEKAGGVAALAKKIGVTSQAVSQWDRVPAERLIVVSRETGIGAHELRPDIVPAPSAAA